MSLLSNLMGIGGSPGLSNLQNGMNMLQKFQQFAANPVAGLMSMNPNLNIPQSMMNNPEAVVRHLISTGQMTQEQYNTVSSLANMAQNFIGKKF